MFVYQLLVPTTLLSVPLSFSCLFTLSCSTMSSTHTELLRGWGFLLHFLIRMRDERHRWLFIIYRNLWRPCLYISNPRTNSSLSSRESCSYSVTLSPAWPLCAVQSHREQEFWLPLINDFDSKWLRCWSHTEQMFVDEEGVSIFYFEVRIRFYWIIPFKWLKFNDWGACSFSD